MELNDDQLLILCINPKGENPPAVARAACTRLIEADSAATFKRAAAHGGRGRGYLLERDFERAMPDLEAALRLEPDNSAHYYNRGFAYALLAEWDLAIADCDTAISLRADYGLAYGQRAECLLGKGDRIAALEDVETAIRLLPELGRFYHLRGRIHLDGGDLARAYPDIERAVRLVPDHAAMRCTLGIAYQRGNHFDHALEQFKGASQLDPTLANPYAFRATLHAQRGDHPAALADARRALELAPDNPDALTGAAWALAAAGDDLPQALVFADRAMSLRPGHVETLEARALVRLKLERFEAALNDYDAALALAPTNLDLLFGRGVALYRMGRWLKGRLCFRQALRSNQHPRERYARFGITIE